MLFDRGHPYFRNFNSTVPVTVIRVKSYVDNFLEPTCVAVRSSISELDLVPKRIVAGFEAMLRNGGGLGAGESYIPVVFSFFIHSIIGLPVSPMYTLPPSQGIL